MARAIPDPTEHIPGSSKRPARLLGERQSITDSKKFRAGKKKLAVRSIRDGFGRAGEWSWELPTIRTGKPAEIAADLAPKVPATVINADHSRPHDRDQLPAHGRDDGLQGDPALREWVRGVARLDLARAPRDVPLHQWQQLVSDCETFMTSVENWAARAAATGWDAMSLFRCYRERPLGRLGSAGLLWNVAGGKLIRLHSDWAVIETPNGAQQTYHRRPVSLHRVLAWQLR